jgi:hypothetical protein
MEQVGQGEDDVEVLDGQQLQLAGVDPCGALGGPTLGTVAVAATVVADLEVPALVALIDVGTERGGAADLDGVQGAAPARSSGCGRRGSRRRRGGRCRPARIRARRIRGGNSRRTSALTAKSGRALEKGLAMRTV